MENNTNIDVSQFLLDLNQVKLMLSAQYNLIKKDVLGEKELDRKEAKEDWMKLWTTKVNEYLERVAKEVEGVAAEGNLIIEDDYDLKVQFKKEIEKQGENNFSLYLMLIEIALFRPYYPIISDVATGLAEDEITSGKLKDIVDSCSTNFKELTNKNLYKLDDKIWLTQGRILAQEVLELDGELIDKINASYDKSIKKINGLTKHIMSKPLSLSIIPSLNSLKLPINEFENISLVLTSIGSGCILSKIKVDDDSSKVIVSGGSILEVGQGLEDTTAIKLLMCSDFALSQTAKLEVVIKEIVLGFHKDIRLAKELIKKHSQGTCELRNELLILKQDEEGNKQLIDETKKALNIMNKGLNIMEEDFLENKKVKLIKRLMFLNKANEGAEEFDDIVEDNEVVADSEEDQLINKEIEAIANHKLNEDEIEELNRELEK